MGNDSNILKNNLCNGYVQEQNWTQRNKRKKYLYRLAQQSKQDPDIAGKIGGMLIYNQLIEQYLVDIIQRSIQYIQADIWPVSVTLEVDIEKATFGKMIEYFRQFATVEPNRDLILSHLAKYNLKRNQVVHDLFDVEDFGKFSQELVVYGDLADEIIRLLEDYDDQVCANFIALYKKLNSNTEDQK